MSYPGSRTTTTTVWLLPEDEAVVGERIAEALPEAAWLCSQPGPVGLHQVHLHPSVTEALICGSGVQALLPLPAGAAAPPGVVAADGVPTGHGPDHDPDHGSGHGSAAVVQLLCARRVREDGEEVFRAGRLAVRWSEPEAGPATHRLLTEQTRLIWRALRSATRPAHVVTAGGQRVSGLRIGPAARDLVSATGMALDRWGGRLRLADGAGGRSV
ncbi:hypothetical protein, partial [Streptomyces sp. NPDC058953]